MLHRLADERLRNGRIALLEDPALLQPEAPSPATRACSSVPDPVAPTSRRRESSGSHWKYIRCTLGERVLISAKPRSWWA